jgi:hypothetical protein
VDYLQNCKMMYDSPSPVLYIDEIKYKELE